MATATETPVSPNPPPIPFDAKDFPNNFSRPKPRIVVVENVYHQCPGRDPVGADTATSRSCESDEQPWVRHTRIGSDWTPLDTGFVTDPFLILVKNAAPTFRTNPTESERIESERRVIEVGIESPIGTVLPFTAVRPGDSIRLYPLDGAKYSLRSRLGFTQVTINAFPG